MEIWKKIGKRLLFPHPAVVTLLVMVAAFMLIWSFAVGWEIEYIAYFSYFLSAYALTLVCVRAPALWKTVGRMKQENRYLHRYFSDEQLQVKLSLYISVGINGLYALLQLGMGFYHRSIWFFTLAGYYALLATMRFLLLKDTRKAALGENRLAEFYRYRFCGMVLLLVNLALVVIVTFIVWQNRGFVHSEILTIAMAAYTFYSMVIAVINVLKYRSHESPAILAAKSINLTAALVSMLSLETAMLTAFGSENSPQFRQIMTASTGFAVCLLVLIMAVYMIVRGSKEIRKLKRSLSHEQRTSE